MSLLLLSLLGGSVSQATENVGEADKTGEVHGTILDASSNEPIRKALVILRNGEEVAVGTYTDDAGKFVFHAVDPGTYLISAERSGFIPNPNAPQQSVKVAAGDGGEPITLKLDRTGAISGRIVDANGAPVTGASVQLQPLNRMKSTPANFYASSDDRGNYRVYNIPPSRYKLSAMYSARRAKPRVKIQVENDKAKDASPEAYGTTYYPGTLDPAQGATIQVDPGADIQGIDIELQRTRAVRIRGRVNGVDSQLLAQFVMIVLTSLNGGNTLDTQVSPNGTFELVEVTPGKYSLSALGFLQDGKQLRADRPLEVGETDIDGVQLTLGRGQTVTGTVIMPAGQKLPAGLVVVLHPREQSGRQFGSESGGFAQLNENGTFSLEGIVPGDYDLVVGNVAKADDLYIDSIRSGDQDVLVSGLHVTDSVPPPMELVLKPNGAKIVCTVLDEKDKPVPEAHVTILPDPPRRSQIALREECRTNAFGECTLRGIAPGDYHVFAVVGDDFPDFSDLTTMKTFEEVWKAKAIAVEQGDRNSLQLGVVRFESRE